MSLTLSQFLFLVLTIAAVVAVTFLVLFLSQLKKTAQEGEKTLREMRTLAVNLNTISQSVNEKLDGLGDVVDATRKAAVNLSDASQFFSRRVMRPASRYWPLIVPALRLVWRQMRKKKEEKNG
jgi:methyl-accepting chemotaxis protein